MIIGTLNAVSTVIACELDCAKLLKELGGGQYSLMNNVWETYIEGTSYTMTPVFSK